MYNDNYQILSMLFNTFNEALNLCLFYRWEYQGTLRSLIFYSNSFFQMWFESLQTE